MYIPESAIISVNSGKLIIGKNFGCNYGFFVSCVSRIQFGDDCIIGWNCTFLDGNGHTIYSLNEKKSSKKSIVVGNHSWICAECTFLKGAQIKDETVVSYGTIVNSSFDEGNIVIGGNPARKVKQIKGWKK